SSLCFRLWFLLGWFAVVRWGMAKRKGRPGGLPLGSPVRGCPLPVGSRACRAKGLALDAARCETGNHEALAVHVEDDDRNRDQERGGHEQTPRIDVAEDGLG